jgi:ribosomal protein L37AE/L43A
MNATREASVDWVKRALSEALRDHSAQITTRAENLVAIAEDNRIPIEELVVWVYRKAPGKEWTAAEFRRFAEKYAAARTEVLHLRENDPWRQLCPVCHMQVAHRVGNAWRCTKCGEVRMPGGGT